MKILYTLWILTPCQVSGVQIFSSFLWVAFSLNLLHYTEVLKFDAVPFVCLFLLLSCVPMSDARNHYQIQHPEVFPLFPSIRLLYLGLWSVWGWSLRMVSEKGSFILLLVGMEFPQHNLLKKLSFPHPVALSPSLKTIWPHRQEFISGLSILAH